VHSCRLCHRRVMNREDAVHHLFACDAAVITAFRSTPAYPENSSMGTVGQLLPTAAALWTHPRPCLRLAHFFTASGGVSADDEPNGGVVDTLSDSDRSDDESDASTDDDDEDNDITAELSWADAIDSAVDE
jgi:hypothetical protein